MRIAFFLNDQSASISESCLVFSCHAGLIFPVEDLWYGEDISEDWAVMEEVAWPTQSARTYDSTFVSRARSAGTSLILCIVQEAGTCRRRAVEQRGVLLPQEREWKQRFVNESQIPPLHLSFRL